MIIWPLLLASDSGLWPEDPSTETAATPCSLSSADPEDSYKAPLALGGIVAARQAVPAAVRLAAPTALGRASVAWGTEAAMLEGGAAAAGGAEMAAGEGLLMGALRLAATFARVSPLALIFMESDQPRREKPPLRYQDDSEIVGVPDLKEWEKFKQDMKDAADLWMYKLFFRHLPDHLADFLARSLMRRSSNSFPPSPGALGARMSSRSGDGGGVAADPKKGREKKAEKPPNGDCYRQIRDHLNPRGKRNEEVDELIRMLQEDLKLTVEEQKVAPGIVQSIYAGNSRSSPEHRLLLVYFVFQMGRGNSTGGKRAQAANRAAALTIQLWAGQTIAALSATPLSEKRQRGLIFDLSRWTSRAAEADLLDIVPLAWRGFEDAAVALSREGLDGDQIFTLLSRPFNQPKKERVSLIFEGFPDEVLEIKKENPRVRKEELFSLLSSWVETYPGTPEWENLGHVLDPSADSKVERERARRFGQARVLKLKEIIKCAAEGGRRITFEVFYAGGMPQRVIVQVGGGQTQSFGSVQEAMEHYHVKVELAHQTEYEVSPYSVPIYREVTRMTVKWDRERQTLHDAEGNRMADGIEKEEALFEFLGKKWRGEEKELLRQARRHGVNFSPQTFMEYREKVHPRLRLLKSGDEGTVYRMVGEPMAVKEFGDSDLGLAESLLRDQVRAFLRIQRALEKEGVEGIRVPELGVVGRDFLVREWVPRRFNEDDMYGVLEMLEQIKASRSTEMQVVRRTLERMYEGYQDESHRDGWNVGKGPDGKFVLYDPGSRIDFVDPSDGGE
ncbi:MAG: hypothetical protein HYU99_09750 [Deltaproteobacteria bacterium]|nr:hypothetical protein [Deltaproteobacteria bacterium]